MDPSAVQDIHYESCLVNDSAHTECIYPCNCKLHSNSCSLDYIVNKPLTCGTWLDECLQFKVESGLVTIATPRLLHVSLYDVTSNIHTDTISNSSVSDPLPKSCGVSGYRSGSDWFQFWFWILLCSQIVDTFGRYILSMSKPGISIRKNVRRMNRSLLALH